MRHLAERLEVPVVAALPEIRFRPFRDVHDYQRIADLVKACNLHDDIPWLPTADNLRGEMEQRSSLDPPRDVLLAEFDGRVVAMTEVDRIVRDGTPVYEMSGSVLPPFRRRGLGTTLLDWTFRRARQRAAIDDPGQSMLIQGEAEEQEAGHRALLAGAGFEPVRHFFLMRRPNLDDAPDAPLPAGLEIRPVTAEQRRQILEAEFEAFQDHWGSRDRGEDSYAITLSRRELDTDLWVVAWDRDEVAGVVENWIWSDENADLGVACGWLERISVRRPWRRRGLARALTALSISRLKAAGMTEAMLGVDSENANGALGLYESLGFQVHSRSAVYRRPLGSSKREGAATGLC